jgi:hypothetical protein
MPSLNGRAPKDSYSELLKLNNTGAGLTGSLLAVQDGTGVNSPLQLSTSAISLNGALWPSAVGQAGQIMTALDSNGTLAWVTPTFAPLASPALTGTPTAPTATSATNTTQIATTAFVQSVISGLAGGLNFVGTWNANTNTPTITSSTGTKGQMYKVATAGTTTINGVSSWNVGDIIVFDGSTWDKIDGQATEVISFNTRTGAITLSSSDVTTALGFTPANATSLSSYATLISPTFQGTVTIPSGAAIAGYAPSASPTITGRTQSDAYSYTVIALGNQSGTLNLNLTNASEWTVTVTGNLTFAFTNSLASNTSQVIYLRLTNAGAYNIYWPTSTQFAAGTAPTFTTSGTDLIAVKYDTTSATYMVFVIGLAMAV